MEYQRIKLAQKHIIASELLIIALLGLLFVGDVVSNAKSAMPEVAAQEAEKGTQDLSFH